MKIEVFSQNGEFIKSIIVTKENSFNKRLKMDKTILDFLLDSEIQMPFGCMGGSCGACIVDIESGMKFIDREGSHKIVLKSLEENSLLTCIATITDYSEDAVVKMKLRFEPNYQIR